MNRLAFVLIAIGITRCACVGPQPPLAAATTKPAPDVIDEAFRRLKRELPAPTTFSEQNGPSCDCGQNRFANYNLLDAVAAKLPITSDSDLAFLVPWARDSDACVRQVALTEIVTKIGYDRNNVVIPIVHDPEHHIHHDVLFSLKAFLDVKHIHYDPRIFDGLLLAVSPVDYAALVHGRWEQEIDRKTVSIDVVAQVEANRIRVTHRQTTKSPGWSDYTLTTQVKGVIVDDRGRYVLSGASTTESPANSPVEPAQDYQFWLVKPGLAWFKDGNSPYWIKLRRLGPP